MDNLDTLFYSEVKMWRQKYAWSVALLNACCHIPKVIGKFGPGQLSLGQLGPGQLGPGAQLSGAQFATFSGRTVRPRTIGPRAHLVFAMIFLMIYESFF